MTELVRMREDDDCTLCCISMATDIAYERVREVAITVRLGYRVHGSRGTHSAAQVLGALGVDCKSISALDEQARAQAMVSMLWGRRAIVAVPSLNGFPGHHDVYWDGRKVFDPSPGETYSDLAGTLPDGVVIFSEVKP